MKTDFTNLKVRMETSNVEKILIVEDEPSPAKCQKCKSYPCLGVNLSPKKTLWRVKISKNILKIRLVNMEPFTDNSFDYNDDVFIKWVNGSQYWCDNRYQERFKYHC